MGDEPHGHGRVLSAEKPILRAVRQVPGFGRPVPASSCRMEKLGIDPPTRLMSAVVSGWGVFRYGLANRDGVRRRLAVSFRD
jgi:hypothetical protein